MLQSKTQLSKIWLGLAAAALGSFAMVGCGGGEDTSAGTTTTTTSGTGQLPPNMGSDGGGGPVGAGPATGGPGASPFGGGAQQQQTAAVPAGSPPRSRQDPFRPWFNTIPPPPNVMTLLEPARIAMTGTTRPEVQPGIEIQEVPTRRVAGILNGNGVYALLDGGPGGPEVVRPGQELVDGYRVVQINKDSVTLQKKIASQTFTQVVPLTDAGGTMVASAPSAAGGFRPGMGPGFGGPGSGRPGAPGRSTGSGGGASSAGE